MDAQLTQLEQLNERARNYMETLWQLPTAYLAIVMVALSDVQKDQKKLVGWGLFVAGILILMCMSGALEGTLRAVKSINNIENELKLTATAKWRGWFQAPYFLLVVLGIWLAYLTAT